MATNSSSHGYQFIGPLKPGQKPPPPPSPSDRSESWSVFDLLNDPVLNPAIRLDSGKDRGNSNNQQTALTSGKIGKIKEPKKFIRAAGGTTWEDPSLSEWDPDDYRVFCGDLGNDVTDELLKSTFETYPSFVKAKVVRDKRTDKSKGYGFISFKDPADYAKAIKEWDGKYLGCRPIKLRKSVWKDRSIEMRKQKTNLELPAPSTALTITTPPPQLSISGPQAGPSSSGMTTRQSSK